MKKVFFFGGGGGDGGVLFKKPGETHQSLSTAAYSVTVKYSVQMK